MEDKSNPEEDSETTPPSGAINQLAGEINVSSKVRIFLKEYLNIKTLRTWLLVMVIFFVLSNILRDGIQGVENSLLVLMIITGMVVGWLLSISSIRTWVAVLISILIGDLILIVRIGRLGNLLRSLLNQLMMFMEQILQRITNQDQSLDTQTLTLLLSDLQNRVSALGSRLVTWFVNVFRGEPLYDPVAIAIIWSFLIWAIAIWTMWLVFRHKKPILGVAPGMILASASLVYTNKSPYHLIPFLGVIIGLVILMDYDRREQTWKETNLEVAVTIRGKILRITVLLAVMLMSLAAAIPSISLDRISDYLNRLTENQLDDEELVRSLGLEPPQVTANFNVLDNQQWGGLPNQHLIGSNPKLSDQVVLVIQVEELGPISSGDDDTQEQTYYWRSLTYDRYVGRGWVSGSSIEVDIQPGQKTLASWPDTYQIIRQKVESLEIGQRLVFSAGIPLSADQEFQVAWRLKGLEEGDFDLFGASIQNTSYWVDSLQPLGSEAELKDAGQDYPDWIRDRYLQLPDSVPERVIALARDLTVNEATPYERAVAIENYLRRIPYSLQLPPTPPDEDLADYFLFGIQKGYCDYYASSMVVLARAAGIPARLVTGYIGGFYDQDLDAYLVTADLAHSWVEVYFPEYGWIIFEPTGGRQAIDRPAESAPKFIWDYPASFDPFAPEIERTPINWTTLTLLSLLTAVVLGFVGFLVADIILARLPIQKQVPAIYKRIFRTARWMGVRPQPGDTATDFVHMMDHLLQEYGTGSKRADWLLDAKSLLKETTWTYYLVLFHPDQGQGIQTKQTALIYRMLRIRLWYLWLLIRVYPNRFLRFFFWEDEPLSIRPYQKST
jgi:transglutaminase-like putative cysteine protease